MNFYERMLNYIFNHFGKLMPDKLLIKIRYRVIFHRNLDLKHPKTFNEKIQWLKLYDRKVIYHEMADKYKARLFVENRVGAEYLIPLLGRWDGVDEIDFEALPSKFVLKCTHDSQSIIICHDKKKLNKGETKERLNKALYTDYAKLGREWAYKGIKPSIIAEALLVDESGNDLKDYKVFCFNGKPQFIQVDYDRFTYHKRRLYTIQWQRMEAKITYYDDLERKIARPVCLDKMLELSEKLAEETYFLRVDWYVVKEQIYFGEMTFYPGCGFEPITPDSFDAEWGKMLDLPEKN